MFTALNCDRNKRSVAVVKKSPDAVYISVVLLSFMVVVKDVNSLVLEIL